MGFWYAGKSIAYYPSYTPQIKKYNTSLSKKNNAEGLGFDAESGALFIACKGSAHLKKKDKALLKGKKAVYQFKEEELPDAESPFHYEAEIWSGMKSFIRWIEAKQQWPLTPS